MRDYTLAHCLLELPDFAEEHPELCRQYGIKGAPTLVISDGVHFEKYYGVAEIKKHLQDVRPQAAV